QQIMMMHPILFPIWLAGLWFFLMGRGRKYSILGWTYLMLLVEFIVLHGKNYYLAPAYPMLLAGGAVAIEDWLSRSRVSAGKRWLKSTPLVRPRNAARLRFSPATTERRARSTCLARSTAFRLQSVVTRHIFSGARGVTQAK